MPRVAFIGLGRMGHGMAGRYLDAGFAVAVWNRSKAKAEDLIARGARWATSPEDAALDADAVVTMVADDEASRAVWLGTDGAATTMKAGTLAIECSTVSHRHALDMARELNGRGLIYIDCPVTGLPDAAASGKLTLLVGADAADLEKTRPFLEPIGSTIRHFGAVGSGTVYKLINNLRVRRSNRSVFANKINLLPRAADRAASHFLDWEAHGKHGSGGPAMAGRFSTGLERSAIPAVTRPA
jgi:3-hydroxyisobutyrate dehydrogenase-like beta-hydroxyacid dehydrogenase